jgi:hypothetical protein
MSRGGRLRHVQELDEFADAELAFLEQLHDSQPRLIGQSAKYEFGTEFPTGGFAHPCNPFTLAKSGRPLRRIKREHILKPLERRCNRHAA